MKYYETLLKMKYYGILQNIMKHYGTWNIMEHYEILWNIRKYYETLWNIMKHYETLWNIINYSFGYFKDFFKAVAAYELSWSMCRIIQNNLQL